MQLQGGSIVKYVITENGKKLSGIYLNDVPKNWFEFRKNDYLTYPTKKDAKSDIAHVYGLAKIDCVGQARLDMRNRILNFKVEEVA